MNTIASISILGCGWLGLPLAERLLAEGYRIRGSVTSEHKLPELRKKGIEPFLIHIRDEDFDSHTLHHFLESDCLVICFPPGRNKPQSAPYSFKINLLNEALKKSKVKHVLFVSSTSVYPDEPLAFDESTEMPPDKESGKDLLLAENILLENNQIQLCILRMAGLVDADRNPALSAVSKGLILNGNATVNLVHRSDCLEIMGRIIAENRWGTLYNVCADEHPLRKEFYAMACAKAGIAVPMFDEQSPYHIRIIKNDLLKYDLDYEFLYPDPLLMLD